MSPFDDDPPEMPRNQPFDDDAIEAIFAGTSRDDRFADVAAFVSDLRMSGEAAPTPSPALAAALAVGISTELVHRPARRRSGLPKWRELRMKIQGLLAGLGVAGKVALGATLAAAATTGAGAAGILPGPVQHVVASTVGAVTPFSFPGDGQGASGSDQAGGVGTPPSTTTTTTTAPTTTTTHHETPTTTHEGTTVPGPHDGNGSGAGGVTPPPGGSDGTGHGGDSHGSDGSGSGGNGDGVTTTTEHHGDGGTGSGGDGETTTTEPTTTTTHPHDGDSNNPQSLSITCEHAQNPDRIYCQWTASTTPDHDKYVLLRITSINDPGRVMLQSADALAFVDTTVTAGVGYGYRVISLRSDGTVEAHSNIATIMCCGDTGSGTTTTTQHHESTTTTATH